MFSGNILSGKRRQCKTLGSEEGKVKMGSGLLGVLQREEVEHLGCILCLEGNIRTKF
jgi:hypothetical protein